MMAISEALTFDNPDLKKSLAQTTSYFDKDGHNLYIKFLQEQSIFKVLKSDRYFMRSIIQEQPLLINQGPVEGRYRWLFEVPVMLSFMDRGVQDYKNAKPINQNMILTIQIGRTDFAPNEHKVIIERWSGKSLDKKKIDPK